MVVLLLLPEIHFPTFAPCNILLKQSVTCIKTGKVPNLFLWMSCLNPAANDDTSGSLIINSSVIGTYGANIKENETFIYFSKQFRQKELCGT